MGEMQPAGEVQPIRQGMERGRNVDKIISWFTCHAERVSESHNEKALCEYVEQELTGMGIPFERQELDNEVATDSWNISARIPDRSDKIPLLFAFHLDTAAPSNQVEVCVEGRCIRGKGSSVLGADGKLTIAVVIKVVERLMQEGEISHPIELLSIVCRELGLHGAEYADYPRIESKKAAIADHHVTGGVLTRTPARLYMNVELIGHAAHVIHNEEPGVNAPLTVVEIIHQISVGRLDDNLSINAPDLVSPSPFNAASKYVRFDMEIRCFGNDIEQEIQGRVRHGAEETAERMGCKCNIKEEEDVPETNFSENTGMLERLVSIYNRPGLSMIPVRSFGVLGATCTSQLGIRIVPIDFSIYHSHSAREYIVIEGVKRMLRLVENIIRYF